MRTQAEDADFRETPDGAGYFGTNKKHNAYIEIIPYDKMIGDAIKRNQAFFDKLELPRFEYF